MIIRNVGTFSQDRQVRPKKLKQRGVMGGGRVNLRTNIAAFAAQLGAQIPGRHFLLFRSKRGSTHKRVRLARVSSTFAIARETRAPEINARPRTTAEPGRTAHDGRHPSSVGRAWAPGSFTSSGLPFPPDARRHPHKTRQTCKRIATTRFR